MNLDAHRDADEVLARSEHTLRFPRFGHVLYLDLGLQVCVCVLEEGGGGVCTHMCEIVHMYTHTTKYATHAHTHICTHIEIGREGARKKARG